MFNQKLRVVVTGAYGGIGKELCRRLARQGADIFMIGRDQKKLSNLYVELQDLATPEQQIQSFVADLSKAQEVQALCSQLLRLSSPPNVLINNAGANNFAMFESTSDQTMNHLLEINTLSPMRMTRALLPHFQQQPWSRIINVGSVFGSLGYPGFSAYSASKFALRGFSESLARELSDTKVSVGHFVARATNTPMNNSAVMSMNKELGTAVDHPELVAEKLVEFIRSSSMQSSIGWPEKISIRLNAILPSLVSQSISKQLSTIKRFAKA